MNIIYFLFVALALGFHPVKDFRVKDIKPKHHRLLYKDVKDDSEPDLVGGATQVVTATEVVTTTNSFSNSVPTIELDNDVQIVFTDSSQSIYYVTCDVLDLGNGYNQTFQLLLDTGSSVSWIFNQSCTSNACQQTHINKFNDFAQPITVESEFSLAYSGQMVDGSLINGLSDNLLFEFEGFTLSNLTIGLASKVPDLFNGFNVSGILGIPSNTDKFVDRNLIFQLNDLQIIDQQIFGLALVPSSQTVEYVDRGSNPLPLPSNYGGVMVVGSKAIDYKDKFLTDSLIYYTNLIVNQDDYWLINLVDVQILNSNGTFPFNDTLTNKSTIIDTGTTGFVLPLNDANALHQQLFGDDLITDNNGNYAFPCNSSSQNILFSIDSHTFEISVRDFQGKQYTTSGLEGYCASMIQGLNSPYWVFGAAFLSKYYTVFDLEQSRIGFGDARISSYALQSDTGPIPNAITTYYNTTTSISSSRLPHTSISHNTTSHEARTSSDNSGGSLTFSNIAFIISLILCII